MTRRPSWHVRLGAAVGLALLYVPLLFVAVASFNRNRHGQTWGGFTLHWYAKALHSAPVQAALANTLIVAVTSTLVATVLGTLLAVGLHRTPWPRRLRSLLDATVNLPVVTPDILFAIALVGAYGVLRSLTPVFEPGLVTLVVGHVTFQISFVVLVVLSRLAAIGPEQLEAARDLYATTWGAWRRVVLPQLATGIIAGALLAFALSLDDFIISFFVSGPTTQTLPLLIYGSLRRGLSPEIHALSTAMVVLTLLALLGALHWRQLSEQTSAGARWMRRGLGATGAVMLLALALLGAKGLRKPAGQEGHPPVNVLMYSEYIDPAMIGEFTALTGYPLNIEVYEAQEEMIAKLQAAGAGEYDVIVASDVAILQMRQLGLIQRLNREALPNARNLDPLFLHAPFDPDNAYTEPYLWGTTGILYRDAELEPAQVSWSLLFEPGKARGNFLLLDESRTMLSVGLDAIGRDSNSTSREDIRAAAEAILRAKHEPHCVGFDGSVGGKDKVLAGTAWAAIVFNGEAMAAMGEDETLQYAIPSEGSSIWLDTMTVSSGSRNVPGAHAFINYILSADAGAKLANFVQFGSPNAAARPQLTPEDLSNPVIYPDAATLKRLKYLRDPGPAQRTYDEAWTAVKSR